MSDVGEISWGLHSSLERERKIRRRLFASSIKHEIRHFHVEFVQWRPRIVQKSVLHVQSCFLLNQPIECFHMTSRWPYWCPKTMKRPPCWCPKPVLWDLNSFLMEMLSFVPINLHRYWSREWKHSIAFLLFQCFHSRGQHLCNSLEQKRVFA